MDSDNILVTGILLFFFVVLGIPVFLGLHNDNLIQEYVKEGMDPLVASCLVTGNDKHCTLVAKEYP
jgi:hypothetical protein